MGTVYNIRGTNGSGKTTLARQFMGPPEFDAERGGPVLLNTYPAPTKKEPERLKRAEGMLCVHGELGRIATIGRYSTACGGMDTMPSFEVCQIAISWMLEHEAADHVIAEGILASTVYGSWGKYSEVLRFLGHRFAFCYLDTPLEVCKERILRRQKARDQNLVKKEINWQLVDDKYESIRRSREKAIEMGEIVYDIPYLTPAAALKDIMKANTMEHFRGK